MTNLGSDLARGLLGRLLLLAAALAPALLAGCMGTPTREILLPQRLKGALVTANGDEAWELKQGISAVVPIEAGMQEVRVTPYGGSGAVIVQRTDIRVFEKAQPMPEAESVNIFLARIDQGWTHRSITSFPEEPLVHLGHDFDPPKTGEGVIILASVTGTAVTIDGKPREGLLKPRGAGTIRLSYVTRPAVVRLAAGKHVLELTRPGYKPIRAEVEVGAGEYQVVGATFAKIPAEPEGS